MPTRTFRLAILAAGLAIVPGFSRFAAAADDGKPLITEGKRDTGDKPANGDKPSDGNKPATGDKPGARPAAGRFEPAAILERVQTAVNDLKLSEEQKTKVEEAVTKAKKAFETLTKDTAAEGRDRLQSVTKVMGELKDSLTGTLNEEQFKMLMEKVPMFGRLVNRPAGDTGRPGAEAGAQRANLQRAMTAAMEKLNFTEEQKTKIKALNDQFETKYKALAEETKGDRAALGEKIRPMMEERRKQMQEILSSEQGQKLQEEVRLQMQKLRGESADKPETKKQEEKK